MPQGKCVAVPLVRCVASSLLLGGSEARVAHMPVLEAPGIAEQGRRGGVALISPQMGIPAADCHLQPPILAVRLEIIWNQQVELLFFPKLVVFV